MEGTIKEFRDGIFALRTRRFGTVAELMIKNLYHMGEAKTLAYDKYAPDTGERVEIKFSTVMKENDAPIRENNVIEQCIRANPANRAMASWETKAYKFDCNIQQIKPKEFDQLYYGLFFADMIEIYSMTSSQVLEYTGYSNRQHRGNEGEGQFHLTRDTVEYHRKHCLQRKLTYEKLYHIFDWQPKQVTLEMIDALAFKMERTGREKESSSCPNGNKALSSPETGSALPENGR